MTTEATAPAPAPASLPPRLQLQDISVSYLSREGTSVEAVRNVSLTIDDKPGCGEVVVLLGPSGCGKSTLLKCIAGLMTPTHGQVRSLNENVVGTSRDRGMVFQAYTAFTWLTVQGNIEYGLALAGVPKIQRDEKAKAALVQVGLSEFAGHYPKDLSGGMKQRLAIARTLVNQPKLLLLDEPFGALDPQTRWGMQGLLLDISRKLDNTTLLVTHDVSEAVYVADTIYVLSSRPAKILHRIDVPYFESRESTLRQSTRFREVEDHILGLLQQQDQSIHLA